MLRSLPRMIPLIYHKSGRPEVARFPAVALPLYEMFDRRTGEPRFLNRAALCEAYGVCEDAFIVLTGTDRDAPLERWWAFGEETQRSIIRNFKQLDVALVTTPNFSLFSNRPRTDDMHSMKRIAISHQQFLAGGLSAALHVNGRTDRDFERWAEYIEARAEVTELAYEFATGTGQGSRRQHHARWLIQLASSIPRALTLVVRGGTDLLPDLANSFAQVIAIDSTAFMKTMMRKKAVLISDSGVGWQHYPTERSESLHGLLVSNVKLLSDHVSSLSAHPSKRDSASA
jgi:hypothetical protein